MTTWHVPGDVLTRFAVDPARIDDVTASSVETHLTGCAACRAVVAAEADPAALERSWQAVVDAVDRPQRGPVEWFLARLVPAETARLVAATPALQLSWLAASVAMIGLAVAVSRTTGSPAPFLVLAPLVPLAGVAAAFWPDADPGGEAGAATPLATGGLLLRRAQAVVASSIVVLGAGAVALPDLDPRAAAWLLPAILLTVTALAGSTWVAPYRAVAATASAWAITLAVASVRGRAAGALAESALFAATGQMVFAALTVVAMAALVARRRHFSFLEAR